MTTFIAEKGSNIHDETKRVKNILKENGSRGGFLIFNDIQLAVSSDSNPNDIATIYFLKNKLRQNGLLNND
jgi:hypothetical protein